MKLLLHTCCAPCSVYCIDSLRDENIEPTVYWFNPNIHPYMEYKTRRDTLIEYTKSIGVEAIFEENYGLREFCKNTINNLSNRCKNYCYSIRLEKTAKYAKENGYDTFSTTLLVSPYQNHEAIKTIGKELAKKYGIEFLYRDFRVGFRQGQNKARELGLYMQKYCGCVFSEENSNNERIEKDIKRSLLENKITEKKIRLKRSIPNLDLRPFKREGTDDYEFVYNLKKIVYQKYVKENWNEWNEEAQRKLFEKFIKKNAKHIQIIMLNNKDMGFFNGNNKEDGSYEIGNICVIPECQRKGVGTAILEEIIFEHNNQDIQLQVFKQNADGIKLYEKLGFEKVGETETHYQMKKSVNNKK